MTALADRRATRFGLSSALLFLGVLAVVGESAVRRGETDVVGAFVKHVLGLQTYVNPFRPQVFVTKSSGNELRWEGVTITAECTSSWLLGPLFALAAMAALGRRLTVRAVVVATALTAGVLVVVNLARIAMIVYSLHAWGAAGYRWSHEIIGSIVSVIGVCAGGTLFLVVANLLSRRGAAADRPVSD